MDSLSASTCFTGRGLSAILPVGRLGDRRSPIVGERVRGDDPSQGSAFQIAVWLKVDGAWARSPLAGAAALGSRESASLATYCGLGSQRPEQQ